MSGTPQIFVSYRRDDSADITGRIYDRLVQRFGDGAIFRDIDAIPLGVDFRTHIDRMVGQCNILLAIIGQEWVSCADEAGNRRLDDPGDFVRLEIQSALKRTIPVIPLLVRGASMPREDELPAPIRELAYRNGTPIRRDPDFHHDLDRLITGLEGHLVEEEPAPTAPQTSASAAHRVRESAADTGGSQSPAHAGRAEPAVRQARGPGIGDEQRAGMKKAPSYWKAFGFHLLFGFGLFYVDKSLRRKWLYPIAVFYSLLDLYVIENLIISNSVYYFGQYTLLISSGIYVLGFLDVFLTCRSRRQTVA